MQRRAFIFLLLLAGGIASRSQDSIPAQIHVEQQGDSLRFSATLRPLRQLAGAPPAYYSYFWELGDGRFSFDKDPSYAYRDTGLYQVRLFATNNYDDGSAPPTRPRPIHVKKGARYMNSWASHFFHGDGGLELKVNRNPKPGENFVVLVGYRNQFADSLTGSIVLFYNERQFRRDGFALTDERLYDKQQPSDLNTLLADLGRVPAGIFDASGRSASLSPHSGLLERSAAASFTEGEAGEDLSFTGETRSYLHMLDNDFSRHTVLRFPAI
ncbi:MAG TPA: PKD domain-containing protein, partial [Puia sp.]|nr:PKD domain-containing protein [Puia sp.]